MKLTAFLCLLSLPALAGNWPSWRGPNHNGISSETGIPVSWSADNNIRWKIKLDGRSGSSPVVWDDKVFITGPGNDRNWLYCYATSDGSEQWKVDLGKLSPGKHKRYGSGSNFSPVTDGSHVWVQFKSGDFACVDMNGKVVWKHMEQDWDDKTLWWDAGSSPVLTEHYVIKTLMQSGPSYLKAYEKESGKLAWTADRNLDVNDESNQAYSTPVVLKENGKELLITLGADHVTAHDAADGKELWRCGGLNPTNHQYWRSIAGPAVTKDMVIAPYGRGDFVFGIKRGGSGDVTGKHLAWTTEGSGADVPCALAYKGRAYILNDGGELSCLKVRDGSVVWKERIEKHRAKFRCSPIIVNGKLYVTREDGKTFVIATGDSFKILHENPIGDEFTVASLAPANGALYLRSMEHLYCIGK